VTPPTGLDVERARRDTPGAGKVARLDNAVAVARFQGTDLIHVTVPGLTGLGDRTFPTGRALTAEVGNADLGQHPLPVGRRGRACAAGDVAGPVAFGDVRYRRAGRHARPGERNVAERRVRLTPCSAPGALPARAGSSSPP